jgi:hypothetical protein
MVRAIAPTPCLFDCVGSEYPEPSFYERRPVLRHKK